MKEFFNRKNVAVTITLVVIAIALVVIWLAVWLFIRMVIGWVRLLVRLGHRWCRKEIAA